MTQGLQERTGWNASRHKETCSTGYIKATGTLVSEVMVALCSCQTSNIFLRKAGVINVIIMKIRWVDIFPSKLATWELYDRYSVLDRCRDLPYRHHCLQTALGPAQPVLIPLTVGARLVCTWDWHFSTISCKNQNSRTHNFTPYILRKLEDKRMPQSGTEAVVFSHRHHRVTHTHDFI